MKCFCLALLLLAGGAHAQSAIADPRIVALPVTESGDFRLRASSEVTQSILFRKGEQILSVILSDPSAFVVNVAGTQDSLALRAASASSFGIMTVHTNVRTYAFELMAGVASTAPAVVRLVDPPKVTPLRPAGPATGAMRFRYRVSGSKAVQPSSISDDGSKTFIEWARDQGMPATFGLGPTGTEQMVDGYVRGGIFTIDRVYQTLIFRIDKVEAEATRLGEEKSHG